MPAATTHPSPDTLAAFAVGRLADAQIAEVEAHVAECDVCCRQLAHGRSDSLLDLARQAMLATPDVESGPALDTPADTPAGLIDHPRYRILGRLGAGGMGVVYKAEHRLMGRTVALKVLAARTTAKAGAVERFRREVRLASRLSHPNIVTAHDADEADGQHFLVMEYVEGVSLDRLVAKKGPLPVAQACHFARQAALGLQHAADKGMVHRDVKPQNLMVTRKGQVKVLDFGLACVARGDGAPAGTGTAMQVTNPDLVLGTPDFLAPEQARSSTTVDVRADLYGLGCTLFYLLTGKPPFAGATALEKLIAHTTEDAPSVCAVRPEVPAALSDVVQKLMAKEPANRFQTPADVAAALLPFTKGDVASPTPVRVAVPVAAPILGGDTPTDPLAAMTTGVDDRPRKRRKKPAPTFFQKHRAPLIGGAVGLALLALAAVVVNQFWGGPPTQPTGSGHTAGTGGKPRVDDRRAGVEPVPADQVAVLIVLPQSNLYYHDYGPVRAMFERRGVTVKTVATTLDPCTRHPETPGEAVEPDDTLEKVDPSKFNGVVFVGAGVGDYVTGGRSEKHVRRIIDHFVGRGRPVGAICLGLRVLGDLGYLNDRSAAKSKYYDNPRVRWDPNSRVLAAKPFVTASTYEDAVPFVANMLPFVKAVKPWEK